MTTPARYVVDAHVLVAYVLDRLGPNDPSLAAFAQAERGEGIVSVPVIALAEIAWLVEKGRITLDFKELVRALRAHSAYQITPLDVAQLLCMVETTEVPEMHDRLITCEAKLQGAKLMTWDRDIRAAKVVAIV